MGVVPGQGLPGDTGTIPTSFTLTTERKAMHTSTLEPLTMLAPSTLSETSNASEKQCGGGCGCEVSLTEWALPQRYHGA